MENFVSRYMGKMKPNLKFMYKRMVPFKDEQRYFFTADNKQTFAKNCPTQIVKLNYYRWAKYKKCNFKLMIKNTKLLSSRSIKFKIKVYFKTVSISTTSLITAFFLDADIWGIKSRVKKNKRNGP